MKLMHFRASCAYAALAAIMEQKGIDTEDTEIALEIKLPWLFAREDGAYVAGPMLQGAKWFDLWLLPRGYRMAETRLERDALCACLRRRAPVMLGLRTPGGKHAVVSTGYDGMYHFINPIHENSAESATMALREEELLSRLEERTVVGEVIPASPEARPVAPLLRASVSILRENVKEIEAFAAKKHLPDVYDLVRDSLFRPLLLDGITMLELAGEASLAREFALLQRQLIGFMGGTREGVLEKALPVERLRELSERYICLIEKQIP